MNFIKKRTKVIFLILYTVVILYCLYFGFGRAARNMEDGTSFSFAIYQIPLWFPKRFSSDILKIWIFAMGNLVAFIPFGCLIPEVMPSRHQRYWKTLIIFLIAISVLECIQGFSGFGSFDMEDILVNTIGCSVGYLAYKIANRTVHLMNWFVTYIMTAILGTMASVAMAQVLNILFFG